jgi:ElaB/YqjD/DUF883 family membrane-anchored ribosome-binding protein
MTTGIEQLREDFQRVIIDIENLAKEAASAVGDGGEQGTQNLKTIVTRARRRLGDYEKTITGDVTRAGQAAGQYVRNNVWTSVAAAASVALLLGMIVGRRD